MSPCHDDGRLRAHLDAGLPAAEQAALSAHLATCPACRDRQATLAAAADFGRRALAVTVAPPDPAATRAAWQVLQARLAHDPPTPSPLSWPERIALMLDRLAAPGARLALSGSLAAVVLLLALVFTPVGGLALQSLSSFRVQTFKAVTIEVDPAAMPKPPGEGRTPADPKAPRPPQDPAKVRAEIEKELAAAGITVTSSLNEKTVREVADLAAARRAGNGAALQTITALPTELSRGTPKVHVADPSKSTAVVDLARFRQALRDRLKDAPGEQPPFDPERLPGIDPNLTQISGTLTTAFGVVQVWGEGERSLIFGQGASPELTLSQGIEILAVRDALLAMPGLSKTTRDQILSIKDEEWSKTLIIPVPQGTVVRNVTIGGVLGVGGVPGLLIHDKDGKGGAVLWERGGILYVVAGGHSQAALLAAANSAR